MRRCLEEGRARGHDVLWLGVWEHNARARAFYARWGFVEVGEMRFLLGLQPTSLTAARSHLRRQ